jgi:hypothetical protein
MAHEFSGSTDIDRPIDEVFAFLADGTSDPKFSPRVLEVRKATDGPVGVGTESRTRVTIHNELEGHGFGKVIVGFATRAAVKDAPALAARIKAAVEAG